MTKLELAQKIHSVAYLEGEFLLRSGQTSHFYFDKYQFESRPQLLKSIAQYLKDLIPQDTDFLAGLEMGGIPIATALSLETGLPLLMVRKEAKSYGTAKLAEGPDFKDKKLCLIEDVITTGGQVGLSTTELLKAGAKISDVLCVIYRGTKQGEEEPLKAHNLKLQYLFQKSDFDSFVQKNK